MVKRKFWGAVKVLLQGSLQVTIPKQIADELGIRAGDKMRVEYGKGSKSIAYTKID